jgi:ubiquitin carboxyl-terminal hydrolase MINDY-1/2
MYSLWSRFPCLPQGNDRKILLQNENGPCPLLAAANALLLRGAIHLPSVCIRNGCASLEEVVNMLAEKAMNYNHNNNNNHENQSDSEKQLNVSNSEQHVHEVLDILPKLQFGMDVNPKFTNGPTGVEFTKELTTFDLLNVKMVHGWLLDPQSQELAVLVKDKSYNQVVESVIHGTEASSELRTLEEQLKKLENCDDNEMIDIGVPADDAEEEKREAKRQSVGSIRKEFEAKQEELSKRATVGELLNSFLEHSGHQLTQYGLSILYEHLEENELCCFFRNNHFNTLTKHRGLLYLLVTDLGYANVPNVVWEKLDVIDGDTEYVDAGFSRPAPHAELSASGQGSEGGVSNLDPEQLLAQRGQAEADYHLALQLSGATAKPDPPPGVTQGGGKASLDEQEGKMTAAALEASLRVYNGMDDGIKPLDTRHTQHDDDDHHTTTQEDRDHILAIQMQAQLEEQDLRLAQQMQETEWAQQRADRQHRNANATLVDNVKSSGCVIS